MEQTKSQELLEQAGIKPRLQLGKKLESGGVQPTGPHRVKFLKDRTRKGTHPITGKDRDEVEYIFEENDVEKTYRVAIKNEAGELNYVVQRMAEFNYGDELVLEMKKKGIKNYIDINPVLEETEDVVDINDEIPYQEPTTEE